MRRMMFSSKTPRDLTSHAAAALCAKCEAEFQEDGLYSEDEHRDYHQPAQHNPPNPILGEFRKYLLDAREDAARWLDAGFIDYEFPSESDAQREHARRVLERLAAITTDRNGETS